MSWISDLEQRENPKVPKSAFSDHMPEKVDFAHFSEIAKNAILRPLHVFRVLSVWAENFVRALTCPKELPNQFSAQTDNTRKTWRGLNLAILAVQGSTL